MIDGTVPLSKIGITQPVACLLLLIGEASRIEWNGLDQPGAASPEMSLHPVPDQCRHPVVFDLRIAKMEDPDMTVVPRWNQLQVPEV